MTREPGKTPLDYTAPPTSALRIGVDLISISRFNRSLARSPTLARRLFSADELRIATGMPITRRNAWLAGRFAAKEALSKAGAFNLYDDVIADTVEVLPSQTGKPIVRWGPSARASTRRSSADVSITHEGPWAIAVAAISSHRLREP